MSGQGGTTGGCGIPEGPTTSVIINLTVVNMTGSGNLRLLPRSSIVAAPAVTTTRHDGGTPGETRSGRGTWRCGR
jgi:hypothetical protein